MSATNIEVKYPPGEKVWILRDGKAVEATVQKVTATMDHVPNKTGWVTKRMYEVKPNTKQASNISHYSDENVFASKEDLIASL